MDGKRNLFIIYERYFDFENHRVVSGGVQTYLTNLIPLFVSRDFRVKLYQCGAEHAYVELENVIVTAVQGTYSNGKYDIKRVLREVNQSFNQDKDVLLFADHCCTINNKAKYCLAIQHGISWDIPRKNRFNDFFMALFSAYKTYREHKKLNYVNQLVCVDYNFPNWYKAQVDEPKCPMKVIPNFTRIVNYKEKNANRDVRIIFARRFVPHRGTRVFADAIDRILKEYNSVQVTIAGRGPDESFLHDHLDKWGDRIVFTQYTSDESIRIHQEHDIAVVPTVGSEGTSLSLLEAMSASCAVICTEVGGMTNIILDGYNGLMVSPGDSNDLYNAIKYLVDNPSERIEMARLGHDTVSRAFSYDKWKKEWLSVIDHIVQQVSFF